MAKRTLDRPGLRKLCAEATEGAWIANKRSDGTCSVYTSGPGPCRAIITIAETSGENGPLIAASREALSQCLDALDEAEVELAKLRADVDLLRTLLASREGEDIS